MQSNRNTKQLQKRLYRKEEMQLKDELIEKKEYLEEVSRIIGGEERGQTLKGLNSQKTLIQEEQQKIDGFKDFLT